MENGKILFPESIHAATAWGEPVEAVPRKIPHLHGTCEYCNKKIVINRKIKGDKSTCPICKQKIDISKFFKEISKKVDTEAMRKYGLLCSISRGAKYGEYPIALSNWMDTEVAKMSWSMRPSYYKDFGSYLKIYEQLLDHLRNKHKDRGTAVHEWIQHFLEGQDISQCDDDIIQKCTSEIGQWVQDNGVTEVVSERLHCCPLAGLAGTIDFEGKIGTKRIIADFTVKHKQKEFEAIKKGSRASFWYKTKQLAGYAHIHKDYIHEIYIAPISNETGEVLFIPLNDSELAAGRKAILANTDAWYANQRYDAREMYKQDRCWSFADIWKGEQNGHG